jgi:hypothetical protein
MAMNPQDFLYGLPSATFPLISIASFNFMVSLVTPAKLITVLRKPFILASRLIAYGSVD